MLKTRLLIVLSLLNLAVMPQALAEDHILRPEAIAQRLSEQAAERNSDLTAVQQVLATPQARNAMRTLGANPDHVRSRVATLSSAELQDLATRARALHVDPVAGLDDDVNTLLVVFLMVAIVILVLGAVQ